MTRTEAIQLARRLLDEKQQLRLFEELGLTVPAALSRRRIERLERELGKRTK